MSIINTKAICSDFSAFGGVRLPSVDKSAWDQFNHEMKTQGRDASILTANQQKYLQERLLTVLRWKSKYQDVIDTVDIGPGMRQYQYRTNNDIPLPKITESLEGGTNVVVTGSDTTVKLFGLHYDIHLDKVTMDAGNRASGALENYSPNLQQNQITEITAAMVDAWNHWIFWGSAYDGFEGDVSVKGICNYTGITNISPSDTNLQTAGDIQNLINEQINGLIDAKWDGPFDVHLSPKVYQKANILYNATTRETDMDLIRKNPNVGSISMNPYIIEGTTETTSTGASLVFKRLPGEFNKVVQTYPLGFYPKTSTDLGWDAKILVYGGVVLERPTAFSYEASLQTA